jgi:hypothetical protein
MSKLARALSLAAMLAAMQLAGLTAVTQAHATDQAAQREQSAADATLRRVLARERFSIPSPAPTQATSPKPPAAHSRPAPALWVVLATVLTLAAGSAVLVARRATRTHRDEAGQVPV